MQAYTASIVCWISVFHNNLEIEIMWWCQSWFLSAGCSLMQGFFTLTHPATNIATSHPASNIATSVSSNILFRRRELKKMLLSQWKNQNKGHAESGPLYVVFAPFSYSPCFFNLVALAEKLIIKCFFTVAWLIYFLQSVIFFTTGRYLGCTARTSIFCISLLLLWG